MWKNALNPWFENRFYKGVVLSGTWVGKRISHYKESEVKDAGLTHEELSIQIELKQSGYNLKGIFSADSLRANRTEKDKYRNIYKIHGHIHDNYVTLEYHPLSRERTGLGTFLMEVKNGGNTLVGDISFLEEGDMEIFTLTEAVLSRVGSN